MLANLGRIKWAARLGLFALALNALVPIHVAFDLGDLSSTRSLGAAASRPHDIEWRLLALLTGHLQPDGKSHKHGKAHHDDCPVCRAVGTLAGFAPPKLTVLPVPAPGAAPAAQPATAALRAGAPLPYRSRAPPTA